MCLNTWTIVFNIKKRNNSQAGDINVRRAVFKMVAVMIMSFIATMVPYAILSTHLCWFIIINQTKSLSKPRGKLIKDLNPTSCEEQTLSYTVVTHLSFASCLINPVVYCFHSPRYRREVIIWFTDKFLKIQSPHRELYNRKHIDNIYYVHFHIFYMLLQRQYRNSSTLASTPTFLD